eukprot:3869182-Prymnesium_polylepis.1
MSGQTATVEAGCSQHVHTHCERTRVGRLPLRTKTRQCTMRTFARATSSAVQYTTRAVATAHSRSAECARGDRSLGAGKRQTLRTGCGPFGDGGRVYRSRPRTLQRRCGDAT